MGLSLSVKAFLLSVFSILTLVNGGVFIAHQLGAFEDMKQTALVLVLWLVGLVALIGLFVVVQFPHTALTLYIWLSDLFASSYFATWWKDLDCEEESCPGYTVVAKTRGGRQYYRNRETNLFDLQESDLQKGQQPVRCNDIASAQDEAVARNHALSVQRKAVAGGILVSIGILLEVVGIDISIFTSGGSDVTVNVPATEVPTQTPE